MAQRQAAEGVLGRPDATGSGAVRTFETANALLVAYTTPGEVGVEARPLVEDDWGGGAEELIRTGSAILSAPDKPVPPGGTRTSPASSPERAASDRSVI